MATINGVPYIYKPLPASKVALKATYPMKAVGYTLHNTYNDVSAEREIAYMQTNNNQVSYTHAVDDLGVVQGLPSDRNGWHAGDGGNGYGNRNTWGVEICYSKNGGAKYDKGETNAILFVAQGLYDNGWDVSKVWKHQDWSSKPCPHRILARSRGWEGIIAAIEKELNRLKAKGSKPTTTTPVSKPTPSVPKPSVQPTKGIDTLAREVMAGKHKDGEARKKSLGPLYDAVQKRVNELSKGGTKKKPAKGIETLAREVMAGKHKDGDARKKSLGNMYNVVQARVNELTNPGRSSGKSLDTLVSEVNRGLHGDGAKRKQSLGADYQRVQAEINRRAK